MNHFLLALLWVGGSVVLGQTKTPDDSTKTNKALTTSDAFLPKITPKSPTSAAMARFGDIPVSLYTGQPTIEIPLFEFTVDALRVPIKLMYHPSGLKVSDQASWVGMGWSLQTGGIVSRQILGLPDEKPGVATPFPSPGTLITRNLENLSSPLVSGGCIVDANIRAIYDAMAENKLDGQRDVFTYQLPSGTNSFMLGPTLSGEINPVTFLMPERSLVQSTTALNSFTLVNENGVTFRFNDTESFSNNTSSGNVTTWLLNEIIGLNAGQRAVYTYATVASTTSNDLTQFKTFRDQVSGASPPSIIDNPPPVDQNNDNTTTQNLLTQIKFPGGKIEFALENRSLPDESAGARLTAISIYGINTEDNTYFLIKKYGFNYIYKSRLEGNSVLFLSDIQLLDAGGSTLGKYALTYNDAMPLPAQSSKARDFWGYFNGQTGNSTLLQPLSIPWQPTVSSTPETLNIPGANRNPDAASMKAWMLQRMSYPTGGYTDFAFEPHQYRDSSGLTRLAGGLRIQTIRSYTANGSLSHTKSYRYGTNGTGKARFGRPFSAFSDPKPEIHSTGQLVRGGGSSIDDPEYSYRQRTYSSVASYPLSAAEGSPVTYSLVTEYDDEGAASIGRTEYTYRDDAEDFPIYANGRLFVVSTACKRGQLLTKTVFDASNRKKYRLENGFADPFVVQTNNALAGLLVSYNIQYPDGAPAGKCNGYFPNGENSLQFIPNYPFSNGLVKISQSNEYFYDEADDSRFARKTTETDYSTLHYNPVETRTFLEGRDIIGTRYTYPQDFTATLSGSADVELQGIKTLQDRNAYQPVETINFRQDFGKDRFYTTGQLSSFTPQTIDGRATPLPRRVWLAEADMSNNRFTDANYRTSADFFNLGVGGNTFTISTIWQPRIVMDSYDARGNLIFYTLTAGASTAYVHTNLAPPDAMPFSVVTSETKNVGLPTIQNTSFTYEIPLLGVSSVTDPRGVVTTYEYDTFGRLVRIKDRQGKVLKQFTYRFATQP